MTSEEIYKVIKTLVGKIEPIADSAVDSKRRDNLEIYIDIVKKMYVDIDDIAWYNRDSPYGSVKETVSKCNKFLDWIHSDEKD